MSAILFEATQANGMTEEELRAGAVARGRRRKINNVVVTVLSGGGLMFLLGQGLGWPVPDSPAVWFAGALAGVLWANGFEYFYHRFLLHRPGALHARHHLRHHATANSACAAEHIALGGSPLRIVALYAINGMPIVATDYLLGFGIALPVIAAFTVYLLCVEEIHWRLHMTQRLPRWLRSARDRHEMHHDRPQRCFNIFLPIFDWIFGTLSGTARAPVQLAMPESGIKTIAAGTTGCDNIWRICDLEEVNMRRLTLITLSLFLLTALNGSLAEAQNEVKRTWSEMAFVVDHEIALSLPDGTYVQGKALAVRPDGIDMDVKKTSEPGPHPKGKTTVPRSSISSVELRTKRRSGRSIGAKSVASAASVGGFILGGVIGEKFGSGDSIFVGMAVGTVVGAVGGVLVGQKLDTEQETVFIRIVPDTPDVQAAPASGASRRSDDPGYWRVGNEAVVDSISPSSPRRIWPR